MIRTEINPPWLDAQAYVNFLSRGFKSRWDRKSYHWYLRREFNGKPTDIIVRSAGTQVLAGAAFCYRQVADGKNAPLDVCIMSAGTTVAFERRRGHYAALLEAGIELCRTRACAALLGFVTRDNGSAHGLLQIGAFAVPTHYLSFDGEARGGRRLAPAALAPRRLAAVLESGALGHSRQAVQPPGYLHFSYPNPLAWHQQFVQRSNPVSAFRIAHDSLALVEAVGDSDRLQWLSCPPQKTIGSITALAGSSRRRGRHFFVYSSDGLLADAITRAGANSRGGYLMVLPIDSASDAAHRLGVGAWRLQSGDRM